MSEHKDPLLAALKEGKSYTWTTPDGGDFASMRKAIKHGQTLTMSPVIKTSEVQVGDIVLAKWHKGHLFHLVGEIQGDQVLIVNSLGKVNGWISGKDILGRITNIIEPEPRPSVLIMLEQLSDAQTIEAAAFHEAFGDMTAMLSALQVPSFRQKVFDETAGVINRASRLSRLAEQLGAAIGFHHPDVVESDCLRNAVNSFFYRDPQTLPPSAPASQLSSEPHSFSRVFTAAFIDVLAGILKVLGNPPSVDNIVRASQDAGRLLLAGVLDAPVVPDYYSQVAAHMISAGDAAPFAGKYRATLKSAFVRRGILSLQAATTITASSPRRSLVRSSASRDSRLPEATISGSAYGLTRLALRVHTAEEAKQFAVTSSSLTLGPVEPRSAQNAAESYTEDLFQRGRVDVGSFSVSGPTGSPAGKTHVVIAENGDLALKRRTFECGFDLPR